jgi:sulfur carrier protein
MTNFEENTGFVTVTVNGKTIGVEHKKSLEVFLLDYRVDTKFVAVAYNGIVLRKEEFSRTVLRDGDKLEIVKPVGGG